MSKAALKTDPPVPPVGALVKMRFGASDVVATVLEDRGPLGMGGRHLVRVKFFLEGTADPVETEVPVEDLTVVALPNDPAEKRIGVEAVGDVWVGIFTDPNGRVAVITEEMRTAEQAMHAALRWVRAGLAERTKHPTVHGRETAYVWKPHPRHHGRYAVYRRGRLGEEIVREAG